MKEAFSKAVQKMKRKDFLDDYVREKTAEDTKLTAEAQALRKKNGVVVGSQIDLRIFQINMRKAEIAKLITKCKAEIKTLKAEILELLVYCYAKAELPENKAKIESACYHAFEDKVKLLSDKDAGGVMGETKIVGAIITHDKKKRYTTAKLVKAGAKNAQGRILKTPEIVVYDYDKKQEEGIYRDETDEFREKIKGKKQNPVLSYLADTYIQKNSVYALGVTALYAIFAVWSAIGGFGQAIFSPLQIRFSVAVAVLLGIFTLLTLKTGERGGICDILPLTAVLISLVSFACLSAYDLKRGIFFPVFLFCYGIVAIILRGINSKKIISGEDARFLPCIALVLGYFLSIVLDVIGKAPLSYAVTAISLVAVYAVFSAVGCFLWKGEKKGRISVFGATLSLAFCVCFALLGVNRIIAYVSLLTGVLEGLAIMYEKRGKGGV